MYDLPGLWARLVTAFKTDDINEISGKLGLSYQSVHKWQNGGTVSIESLVAISNLTSRSIHWLITNETDPTFSYVSIFEENQRGVLEKLAELRHDGKTDDTLRELALEGVKAKIAQLVDKFPDVSGGESEEFLLLVQLIADQIPTVEDNRPARKTQNGNG